MNYFANRHKYNILLTLFVFSMSDLPIIRCAASPQTFATVQEASSFPPMPHWTTTPLFSPESVPQIHVLPVALSATTMQPGAKLNVTMSFIATAQVQANYTLNLALVDAHDVTVAEIHNSLDNSLIILPTTKWNGPVAVTVPITVPSTANGNYFLMLSLSTWHGAVHVSSDRVLQQDGQSRIYVGAISVGTKKSTIKPQPTIPIDPSQYEITFEDTFSTASISDSSLNDHSRWYSQNEQCCMMASDGKRTVMASRSGPNDPFSITPPNGLSIRLEDSHDVWTSGVLTSVDSKGNGFSQQYGYFEMRARFPSGLNTWPAFWLLNTASKRSNASAGEIDIVEYISNPAFANYISTTLHDWSNKTTPFMSHHMVDLPSDGFHTYGMLWTASTMTFYFDGSVTFQCPTPAAMHQPYYLVLDLGLGAGWPTVATPARNDLQIQYVRVYRKH